ncbi:hypothetical protein D1872_272050 [compost metagenome]
MANCIVQVSGNPLPLLQLHQLGDSLVRVLQLALKLVALIPRIGRDGEQHGSNRTKQHEG